MRAVDTRSFLSGCEGRGYEATLATSLSLGKQHSTPPYLFPGDVDHGQLIEGEGEDVLVLLHLTLILHRLMESLSTKVIVQ